MNTLDDTIRTLRERLASEGRLKRRLEQTVIQLSERRRKLRGAQTTLNIENADVERLEGLTLTALFHTLLLNKTEQLDRERQEALRAELVRDECRAAVRRLESDAERLRAEVSELVDAQSELESALDQKEDALRTADGMKSRRLFELGDERAEASAEFTQVSDARSAGDYALDSLQDVIDSLDSADSWGTWGVLGGGIVPAVIKHSHIDASREHAHEAQADLLAFEREVEDIDFSADIELELSGFTTFADYFFDGLISDWIVQSKIHRSRSATIEVQSRVRAALEALDRRAGILKGRLAKLEAERLLLLGV